MKIGDLVSHHPSGSPIEIILRKISSDEIENDFDLGVIIDSKGPMMRIFSHQLSGLHWYEGSELKLVS